VPQHHFGQQCLDAVPTDAHPDAHHDNAESRTTTIMPMCPKDDEPSSAAASRPLQRAARPGGYTAAMERT